MYLTIAHMPAAPASCDPDAELLRPIDPFGQFGAPGGEFLVVRRSREPRVWLAPPRSSWLTTHLAFEVAYAPQWPEAARAAWLPVAFVTVIDIAPGCADEVERACRDRGRGLAEQAGFLSLEVLRPLGGNWRGPLGPSDSTYVVLSCWASAAAYRADHAQPRLADGLVTRAAVSAYSVAFSLGPARGDVAAGRVERIADPIA